MNIKTTFLRNLFIIPSLLIPATRTITLESLNTKKLISDGPSIFNGSVINNGSMTCNNGISVAGSGLFKNDVIVNGTLYTKNNVTLRQQQALLFEDGKGHSIKIKAPEEINTSYSLQLPDTAPTTNAVFKSSSHNSELLEWYDISFLQSATPDITHIVYVSNSGNNTTGDGSFLKPFLTIAKAIDYANAHASSENQLVIKILGGIFIENNSTSPLTITSPYISISGMSSNTTCIQPLDITQPLFLITSSQIQLENITLDSSSSESSAQGITYNGSADSTCTFYNCIIKNFAQGLYIEGESTSTITLDSCMLQDNAVSLYNDNTNVCIQNSLIQNTSTTPSFTGIINTGNDAHTTILSTHFIKLEFGIINENNSMITVIGSHFQTLQTSITTQLSAAAEIISSMFTNNNTTSINIICSGSGSSITMAGCYVHGSTEGTPYGTGIYVTQGGVITISNSHIDFNTIGILIGATDDTSDTQAFLHGNVFTNNTIPFKQQGAASIQATGISIPLSDIIVNNPTNCIFTAYDLDTNSVLSLGNGTNTNTPLLQINTRGTTVPALEYRPNYYGCDTLLYNDGSNSNNNGVGFGLFADDTHSNATYSITCADRTGSTSLILQSDTGTIGDTTNDIRKWEIKKYQDTAPLITTFENTDIADGKSLIATYTFTQYDGFSNTLHLPSSYNNGTTLLWQNDTNLYRSDSNILKTDGELIIGSTTTIDTTISVHSGHIIDSSGSLTLTATELSVDGNLSTKSLTITGTHDAVQCTIIGNTTQTHNILEIQNANIDTLFTIDNNGNALLAGALTLSQPIINNITLDELTNAHYVPTKEYVDTIAAGLYPLGSAAAVATTNFSLTGTQIIDDYTTLENDIVLLTAQTNSTENGPWKVQTTAWIRPDTYSSGDTIHGGSSIFILNGTLYQNSVWVLQNGTGGTIDTTETVFTLFSQPGTILAENVGNAAGTIYQGKTGNTFSFKTLSTSNHATLTNNAATINVSTDATSSNVGNTIVNRDSLGNFSAGTITATNLAGTLTTATQPNVTSLGTLTGLTMGGTLNLATNNITNGGAVSASSFAGPLTGTASGNLALSGGTLTGALRIPAGSTASPSINFTGSTTTGLSASSDNLSFSTSGSERMKISSSGILSVNGLNAAGVVHTDASGNFSTSTITNSDIASSANISDSKLATISTAGKVANSATTATSSNTASSIVARDSSGNFSVGTITATNLAGTLTTASQPNITSLGTLTGLTVNNAFQTNETGQVLFQKSMCAQGITYITPTSGGSVTLTNATSFLVMNISSLLGSFTINLPSTPVNGQLLTIVGGPQAVLTLTFSGGTVVNAPGAFSSTKSLQLVYNGANTTWYVY